jgi:hypothetical protein
MSKIPSDEEFDRASKMMEQQFSSLDSVKDNVVKHFKSKCPLYDFHILPQGDDVFRTYVFFETDRDLEECKKNGILDDLQALVINELARAGRWRKNQTVVAFELDSDENVKANYEGDYFLRLR